MNNRAQAPATIDQLPTKFENVQQQEQAHESSKADNASSMQPMGQQLDMMMPASVDESAVERKPDQPVQSLQNFSDRPQLTVPRQFMIEKVQQRTDGPVMPIDLRLPQTSEQAKNPDEKQDGQATENQAQSAKQPNGENDK